MVGADGIRSPGLLLGGLSLALTRLFIQATRLPHFISDMQQLLLTSGHRANPSTLNQEFHHGCSWISMSAGGGSANK